jgi:PAS domain S-box-containing protein
MISPSEEHMIEGPRQRRAADEEGSGPRAEQNRKHLLPLSDGEPDSSAALFERLLETSPDPVIVVDREGRILFANLQAERAFEYPAGALIGEKVDLLVPQRLRATHAIHRERYAESPRVRPMGSHLTLFGRKRGGTEFPVEISLSPVTVGEHTLFSANIRDITERRQNEIELRRTQGQLLSAVESIQGAFALFDTHDRFVLCNSTYREIVGGRLTGDLVGRLFHDVIEASIASGTFAIDELGAEDLIRRWTAYHESPSGALDVRAQSGQHLRIVERRTADGGVVATIWDVTDEVTSEGELRQARAVAEAASAAKSEFLASMSHELRTPLNAVLGFAQLLQRDRRNPLSPRQLERIEHVLRGGEHLLRLIDDVLDLARIEAGRVLISLEPVKIADVIIEVRDTLAAMADRAQVRLSVDPFEPRELEVVADRTRFKQILMNYGSNAIKYNRPNGTARLRLDASDDMARISVVDDGVGIAEAKQVSLFQPFQRAGQEAGAIEGTGIGLVITKRLAELMKGRVGFESVEGHGSRFWVELPVHRAARASATPPAPVSSSQDSALGGDAGPRYLIVYVEDNPSNIAFMEDLLADLERVQLLTAPTAEIGIELVRARRPDVVIMDINLPGMSGFEATQKLAAWPETRDIPVIALSAAAMIRDAARVAGAGFYRYLTKPVKVDELTATLEELLTRSGKPS